MGVKLDAEGVKLVGETEWAYDEITKGTMICTSDGYIRMQPNLFIDALVLEFIEGMGRLAVSFAEQSSWVSS